MVNPSLGPINNGTMLFFAVELTHAASGDDSLSHCEMGKSIKGTNVSDNFRFILETQSAHMEVIASNEGRAKVCYGGFMYTKQITEKADTVLQRVVKNFA
jgi:hypothetical protein